MKCLPVLAEDCECDGIILNGFFCLFTQKRTFRNQVHEFACHGYFTFWFFAQRYADGVANALCQQCSDSYGTFDTAILSFASFRHTEVQGVVHVLLVHCGYQQSHGCHHHDCVRGFDRNHYVVEVFAFKDAQELHTALHDAFGRIAIARHNAVAEGTVIHTDTDGSVMFLTDLNEGDEFPFDFLQFVGIFLIGVFQMFEGTSRVDIVAWIDAHLLTIEGGDVGGVCGEVHIGHQWLCVAIGLQFGRDVFHIFCLTGSLCCKAYQFAACIYNAFCLCYAGVGIVGIGSCHRLDADGVITSNADITHLRFCRTSSLITHGNIS